MMQIVAVIYISCWCCVVIVLQFGTTYTDAFQSSHQQQQQQWYDRPLTTVTTRPTTIRTVTTAATATTLYQTGGWGIGPQREMLPEEFARRTDSKRIFDGYKLSDRGEFMRQVQRDKDSMVQDELSELLGVAQIAGITVKDPTERLNKFSLDDFDSTNIIDPYDNNDDDLDLSIRWDDDITEQLPTSSTVDTDESDDIGTSTYTSRRRKRKTITTKINQNENKTDDDSITRFDEDTGASGVW
jgi:hypothetical protein